MATTAPAGLAHDLEGFGLLPALAERWWLFLLRGVAAIVFGVMAFAWPGATLLAIALLWGIYAVADGVFALGAAVMGPGGAGRRWWLAVVGVVGVIAGIATFAWPGVTVFVLLMFISAWAVVTGVFQIIGAIRLRKEIEGEWLLILSGVLSVAFGVFLFSQPGAGALATVWIIGAFSLMVGLVYVALAFRLRRHKRPA